MKQHVVREGSRDHVVHWDSSGAHCSVKDCEINRNNPSDPETQDYPTLRRYARNIYAAEGRLDLHEEAKALLAERDSLKAENEMCLKDVENYSAENFKLGAEVADLRARLEANPHHRECLRLLAEARRKLEDAKMVNEPHKGDR